MRGTIAVVPSSLRHRLGAFVQWWGRALADCAPERLRAVLASPPPDLVLRVEGSRFCLTSRAGSYSAELSLPDADPVALTHALAEAGRLGMRLLIELADDHVLQNRLTVPRSAVAEIDHIVALDLDRLTPLAPEEVVFAASVAGPADQAGIVNIDVAIAERALVTTLAAAAKNARLVLAGIQPVSLTSVDLDPTAGRKHHRGRTLTGALGASAIALLLAVLLLTHHRLERDVAQAEAEVARLRGEARVVDRLRQEVEEHTRRAAAMEEARSRPSAATLLSEVAVRLPDDTHLFQLSLLRGELRINGMSGDAARLPPLLEQSPYFPTARLAAPIVRDTEKQLDRFEIVVELRKATSP